jgi:hypothetical protein
LLDLNKRGLSKNTKEPVVSYWGPLIIKNLIVLWRQTKLRRGRSRPLPLNLWPNKGAFESISN